MGEVHTTDATIEAIAATLENNPDGIAYVSDEISGWVLSFNQYRLGKGADRQHWLSFFSRGHVKINRKSRKEPLILARPFVSVVGGIQPDILPELSDERGREGGFIHRVLPSFPDPVPLQRSDDTVSDEVEAAYTSLFEKLWNLREQANQTDPPTPFVFPLSSAARAQWDVFRDAHYAEQDAEDFSTALRGPWAKLEAYYARIALILHCCRFVTHETQRSVVDEDTTTATKKVIDYFKAHERKVYARLRVTPEDKQAEDAVAWIRKHGKRATARDLQMHRVVNIKASSEAKALLNALADRGYGTIKKEGKREVFILV
jgi:hypothetical protein